MKPLFPIPSTTAPALRVDALCKSLRTNRRWRASISACRKVR